MASSPFGAATIVSSGSHLGAQVTRVWSGPSGWLDVASYPIDLYVEVGLQEVVKDERV